MLENKDISQAHHEVEEATTDVKSHETVFIKIIKMRLNGKVKKHYSINKECGKTLAFLDSRDAALFYCMMNDFDFGFVN